MEECKFCDMRANDNLDLCKEIDAFESMIRKYLRTYRTDIQRVVAYRKMTGLPLRECKRYVDEL